MRGDPSFGVLRTGLFLIWALLAIGMPDPVTAQQPPAQLPAGVTEAQVLDRLRQSGMSRQEARSRLAQMGYDPALADPYYDRLEGRTNQQLQVRDEFARALQEMGLLSAVQPPVGLRMDLQDSLLFAPDTIPLDLAERPDTALRVFGRSVFSGRTDQFQPLLMGPVDATYRIGPGDELFLVLTGDVELAYTLDVTREGYVVIPDVGQVFVNGLTLEGLRDQLYGRLGSAYSGIRPGADATTFFDVSLGRLRTNQVFVIGDAVRPGAYLVSSISTVFNALHQAGGPSDLGSFRRITVRRAGGGELEVDLYDYLLRGDASRDVRLDNGDIVFVPPAGAQVTVQGRIRRRAIYEMRPGEGVRDLLGFAGGLQADAYVQRIQIDRVLGADQRMPGVERVVLDVDLQELADPAGEVVALRDGDVVQVYAALAERRNRVTLAGSVFRPGVYEYRAGMTVWDLLRRADGLAEEAFRPVAHIVRPVPETGGAQLLRVSLETGPQGQPLDDVPLADRDSVIVYAVDSLATPASVEIQGLVKETGAYRFAEGMTVRDLILAAGGFLEGAEAYEAEVVRLRQSQERNPQIAESRTVALEGNLPARWAQSLLNGSSGDAIDGESFPLTEGDRVFVRRMPGYVVPRTVSVQGEVLRPGPYGLEFREERLSTILERSGGATGEAYVPGAQLLRDSVLVGIDLEAALRRPGSRQDVVLEDGDVLFLPPVDPTVLVEGAVAFESRVLYEDGLSLEDYLGRSGGTLGDADLDRVSIRYPNGERATVRKTLGFRRYPSVQPGSTIFVPRAPEEQGIDWDSVLNRTLTVTTTVITLMLAMDRLGGG